ncbi:beta-glucosidase [Candidatus Gracilibacteria bacterium]|nr:beta-glucosidase [Candidatus Gracilibacteria bacterium]
MGFPKDFVWGAATASYQIEGAALEDGKGLSVWDWMCRQPDKIWSGDTGEVACDRYHRYEQDVQLMGEIGLQAYRFSISWARVIPDGIGKINEKGLSFYDKLVDCLLELGIQPWVTLFHWDYPYALYCRGGWLNPESPDWFAEYASIVVERLSDRVSHWITLNEPQCFIGLGHQSGEHAPGLKLGFADILAICHRVLLAHGKAVRVIRDRAKIRPTVGAALVGMVKIPSKDTSEDIEAARLCMFSVTEKNCWNNTWFADPMLRGEYPFDGMKLFHNEMPKIESGDLETICQSLDFFGVNIYHGQTIRSNGQGGTVTVPSPKGPPLTTMDWQVTPEALYWGPRFLYERYQLPIVVTENGMANCDWVHVDGKVHDPQRIDFLTRYLQAYQRAIDDGIKAKGYFHWTLMDNFEWAYGYKQRFGLIYVDYATQQRILKDSAYWYKNVISSNSIPTGINC